MSVHAYMIGKNGSAMMTSGRIRLVPRSYRKNVIGGPADATVMAYGSLESLRWLLTSALSQEMRLFNAIGQCVWWGQVREIKARLGEILVSVSLDTPKNRIVVRYSKIVHPADPSGDTITTPYAEDSYSVTRWGKLEMLITQNRLKQADAEKLRDDQLAGRKFPAAGTEATRREFSTELYCRGWWDTLNDQLYDHKSGLEEFTEQMNFSHNFGEGTGVTTLAQRISLDPTLSSGYSLNTISLRLSKVGNPTDSVRVRIRRGGWGYSTDNNTIFATGTSLSLTETYLRTGDYVVLGGGPVDANANFIASCNGLSAATIKDHGYIGANTAIYLAVPEGGTILGTGTIAGSLLSDRPYEYNITLDTPVTFGTSTARSASSSAVSITSSAEFWIEVTRTGANDAANFYSVGMSTQAQYARGECKMRVASGNFYGYYWRPTQPNPASMWFKAMGYQTSEQIIADMVGAAQWLRGWIVRDASNQTGEQYRDGTTTILNELEKILKRGVKDGRRYIYTITPDRWIDIQQEPSSAGSLYRLMPDGTLWYGGQRLRRDLCTVGVHARVAGVDLYDYALADAGTKFIEEASYDVGSDRVDTRGRDRNAMFSIPGVVS